VWRYQFTVSDYPFGIFTLLDIVLSVLLQFTVSEYPFGIFTLLDIVLSVLLQFTVSDYPFGIFTLLDIVLSVLLQFTVSDYPFDIFKLFLLVIVFPVMWFTVLITPLISSYFSCSELYITWQAIQWPARKVWRYHRGNQNGKSHDRKYNDQQEKIEHNKGVIRTVNHSHCISGHVIYRSDYPFNIFKLFLLVIVFLVMWFTVLITPLICSNFSCWSLYFLSCDLPFWLPLWYLGSSELYITWQEIQWPTRKVWRYQRGHQNGISHDRQYNDQQEKFEDIIGVIRTVNHMTGNTMTNKKSLKISKG
jgi:hypothetical protein